MWRLLRQIQSVTAIEWGEGELRVVRLGRDTVAVTFPLTAPPEEQAFEVRQRLQDLMRQGMLRGALCLVVPSYVCAFKLLRLSPLGGEGQEQRWQEEAAGQMGLSPEEVEFAFWERLEGVFVTACRKGFLHTYLSPLTQLGLTAHWVVPSLPGLWVSQAPEMAGRTWALLEVRGSRERLTSATIAVGKGESLQLVHPIVFDGGGKEGLVEEVQRVFALYHRTFGDPVTQLFIAGEWHGSPKEEELFLQGLGLSPTPFPLPETGRTGGERLLAAVARAVLNAPKALPTFPSPRPELTLHWRRFEERLVGAVAVLLLIGFIAAVWLSGQVHEKTSLLQRERERVARLRQILRGLQPTPMKAQLQNLGRVWERVRDRRNDPLEILYWISKALPTSVWVTEWAFLRNGQVILRGSALSHAAVAEATRALEGIKLKGGGSLFTEVVTNYARARESGQKTFVDFQVTAWLRERRPLQGRRVGRR